MFDPLYNALTYQPRGTHPFYGHGICCGCLQSVDDFDCRESFNENDNDWENHWKVLSGSWELVEQQPYVTYGYYPNQVERPNRYGVVRWIWFAELQKGLFPPQIVYKWKQPQNCWFSAKLVDGFGTAVGTYEFDTDVPFVVEDRVDVHPTDDGYWWHGPIEGEGRVLEVAERRVTIALIDNDTPAEEEGLVVARVRPRLEKHGVLGEWIAGEGVCKTNTVQLYPGHGIVAADRLLVGASYPNCYADVIGVGESYITIEKCNGLDTPAGEVIITPETIQYPNTCPSNRTPDYDGEQVGQIVAVENWPLNMLQGSGKLRLLDPVPMRDFSVNVAISRQEETDVTYRLYFGSDEDLGDGYYIELNLLAFNKVNPSGALTTRIDNLNGTITLDHEHLFLVDDSVTVSWGGGYGQYQHMTVTATTSTTITVKGTTWTYPQGPLPPVGMDVSVPLPSGVLERMDTIQLFGPDGAIGEVIYANTLQICIWQNAAGEMVVRYGGDASSSLGFSAFERSLGVSSLPGQHIGFECDEPADVTSFSVTEKETMKTGVLTTRTDDEHGVVTFQHEHMFKVRQHVTIAQGSWPTHLYVLEVVDTTPNTITLDGEGSNITLPEEGSEITPYLYNCQSCTRACDAFIGGTVPSCLKLKLPSFDYDLYLKHVGGCNWQGWCWDISVEVVGDDYVMYVYPGSHTCWVPPEYVECNCFKKILGPTHTKLDGGAIENLSLDYIDEPGCACQVTAADEHECPGIPVLDPPPSCIKLTLSGYSGPLFTCGCRNGTYYLELDEDNPAAAYMYYGSIGDRQGGGYCANGVYTPGGGTLEIAINKCPSACQGVGVRATFYTGDGNRINWVGYFPKVDEFNEVALSLDSSTDPCCDANGTSASVASVDGHDCPAPPSEKCAQCYCGTTPEEILVKIRGLTGDCAECNGDYVFQFDRGDIPPTSCYYTGSFGVARWASLSLHYYWHPLGKWAIYCYFYCGPHGTLVFVKPLEDLKGENEHQMDCNFNEVPMEVTGYGVRCSIAGVTCHITSLGPLI